MAQGQTVPVNLPRPLQPRPLSPPTKASEEGGNLQLVVRYADGHWSGFSLDKPVVKIGRRPDNDIILSDQCVSGHHAEFRRLPDMSYELVDCESYNGTSVNGARITTRRVVPGDFIIFGILEASVELKSGAQEAVKTSTPAVAEGDLQALFREVERLRLAVEKLQMEKSQATADLEATRAELDQLRGNGSAPRSYPAASPGVAANPLG